jgi:hypothetical protein
VNLSSTPVSTQHPLASPALHDYIRAYAEIPHVAPGLTTDGQWVRPTEESHRALAPLVHPHAPPLARKRVKLKRSLSAPDVRLASRFLRKAKLRQQAKAGAVGKQPVARVALFQPHGAPDVRHGMTLGQRRDLLRGGRPRTRLSRNVRPDVDSDAGSVSVAAQQAAAEQRMQMKVAHAKRMEERRVEQLRERARLFGIQVATRAAQIKAARAKRRTMDKLPQLDASGRPMEARRNNQMPRSSGSSSKISAAVAASSTDAPSASRPSRTLDAPERKSSAPASPLCARLPSISPMAAVHWSVLDVDAMDHSGAHASAVPLPPPGSRQECELIEQLAQASVAREDMQMGETARAILDPLIEQQMPVVHVPIILPIEEDAPPLLLLPSSPSAQAAAAAAALLTESEIVPVQPPPTSSTPPYFAQ